MDVHKQHIIDYMAQAKHAVEKSPIVRHQNYSRLFLENLNLKQMIKETLY